MPFKEKRLQETAWHQQRINWSNIHFMSLSHKGYTANHRSNKQTHNPALPSPQLLGFYIFRCPSSALTS